MISLILGPIEYNMRVLTYISLFPPVLEVDSPFSFLCQSRLSFHSATISTAGGSPFLLFSAQRQYFSSFTSLLSAQPSF